MASEQAGPDSSKGLAYPLNPIQQFDTLITRSARRASYYITGRSSPAEDLAQGARFHLLRALEVGLVHDPAVIRRLIANAIRDRIRFERSRIKLASTNTTELLTVAEWVSALPGRLRGVFELIYGSGYTQREASSVLGLSQLHITQLHQELLQHGRLDLSTLAA